MIDEEIQDLVASHAGENRYDALNVEGLLADVSTIYSLPPDLTAESLSSLTAEQITQRLISQANTLYNLREQEMSAEITRKLERLVMLRTRGEFLEEDLEKIYLDYMQEAVA